MDENLAAQTTPNSETMKILTNILQKCEFEAKNNALQIPLEDFEDRVLYYTGIPKSILRQIQSKDKYSTYPKTNSINFKTHLIILNSLIQFYERKTLPNFQLLFKKVNEIVLTVQDAEQFKRDVIVLGIDYQTIFNDTKLLMEDPKITFERYSYLKKMNQIRQQKNTVVYYISERIIDENRNFNNPWKKSGEADDICSGEYVFFHALSRNGLANGLFCFSATEEDFYKWVVDILLGLMVSSSVVIFDNSPLHGTPKSKSISMYDTKCDMRKWLREHNVPCSDTMTKSQLYQLIKNHSNIEQMSRVDRIIKANGHQVLRLPTHFEDLSPIEYVWQDIKHVLESTTDLHDKIFSLFSQVTSEIYELYDKQIEERENALFSVDTNMDQYLENLLLDLKKSANAKLT